MGHLGQAGSILIPGSGDSQLCFYRFFRLFEITIQNNEGVSDLLYFDNYAQSSNDTRTHHKTEK